MSTAHVFRKCYALASLFACGQSDEVRVAHKCAVRLLSHASLGVPHKMDGWCGLRYANGAFAPACSRTQHFVSYLLAMSTARDFRKCYALASLFACGLRKPIVLMHFCAMHKHFVYIALLCPHRTANANATRLPYPLLAVTETCPTAIVTEGQSRATGGAVRTMQSIVVCKFFCTQVQVTVYRTKEKHESLDSCFLFCGAVTET